MARHLNIYYLSHKLALYHVVYGLPISPAISWDRDGRRQSRQIGFSTVVEGKEMVNIHCIISLLLCSNRKNSRFDKNSLWDELPI